MHDEQKDKRNKREFEQEENQGLEKIAMAKKERRAKEDLRSFHQSGQHPYQLIPKRRKNLKGNVAHF